MCYHGTKMELRLTDQIVKAKNWAELHHADHTYGNETFFRGHLAKVAALVEECDPTNVPAIVAAWLHDLVEDTDIDLETVEEEFGSFVATVVDLVTDPEGEGWTRREKKRALYEKFRDFEGSFRKDSAALVKLADRYVNHAKSIADINLSKMSMYIKEFPEFISVYGPPAVEAGHFSLWNDLFDQFVRMNKLVDAYR